MLDFTARRNLTPDMRIYFRRESWSTWGSQPMEAGHLSFDPEPIDETAGSGENQTILRSPSWAKSLRKLPPEGFYILPESVELEGGGRWLKNAIVQLGYNELGQGIIFVAEWRESSNENILQFSDRGLPVKDWLLAARVGADTARGRVAGNLNMRPNIDILQ